MQFRHFPTGVQQDAVANCVLVSLVAVHRRHVGIGVDHREGVDADFLGGFEEFDGENDFSPVSGGRRQDAVRADDIDEHRPAIPVDLVGNTSLRRVAAVVRPSAGEVESFQGIGGRIGMRRRDTQRCDETKYGCRSNHRGKQPGG